MLGKEPARRQNRSDRERSLDVKLETQGGKNHLSYDGVKRCARQPFRSQAQQCRSQQMLLWGLQVHFLAREAAVPNFSVCWSHSASPAQSQGPSSASVCSPAELRPPMKHHCSANCRDFLTHGPRLPALQQTHTSHHQSPTWPS